MSVLLGIGILALVALLWATGAIVMHVRRARQAARTGPDAGTMQDEI